MSINKTYNNIDILKNGDKCPVTAGPILRRTKWKSGTWVKYVENESPTDEFTVERSDGTEVCGFLLYGSEDYTDPRVSNYRNYTSIQSATQFANANGTAVLTLISGGARVLFVEYESISLTVGGVREGDPITYSLNEKLKISENGLLCNDPNDRLLLATGGEEVLVVGIVCKVPSEQDPKLGVDVKY